MCDISIALPSIYYHLSYLLTGTLQNEMIIISEKIRALKKIPSKLMFSKANNDNRNDIKSTALQNGFKKS